ncbi:MAG: glycosyltransferase family 39 protein [Chloroflexi bacterium]|nr:glycosyltransferase family 39 protein [Chloroflexota bacterium]
MAVGIVLLLAFALRLYAFGEKGMWWDEGISIYFATLPIPQITWERDFALSLHPPLYYVLLSYWIKIAGSSVFALRFLSFVFGVLTVAVIYQVGRSLFNRNVAWIAAILLAVAPADVYYSQEIRMYSLTILLGLLSMFLAARLLGSGDKGAQLEPQDDKSNPKLSTFGGWMPFLSYILVTVLGLYTYYYVAFVMVAQNIWALIIWYRKRRLPRLWLAAQIAVVFLYIPWLYVVALRMIAPGYELFGGNIVPGGVLEFAKVSWLAISAGEESRAPLALVLTLPFMLAIISAFVYVTRGKKRRAELFMLFIYLPTYIILVYAFTLWRPLFYPRMVIFLSPLIILIASFGVGSVMRRHYLLAFSSLLVLLAAGAAVPALDYDFQKMDYTSEGFRQVLDSFDRLVDEKDLVLATYVWQAGYVAAYSQVKPDVRLLGEKGTSICETSGSNDTDGREWIILYDDKVQFNDEVACPSFPYPLLIDQYSDTRLYLMGNTLRELNSKALAEDQIEINYGNEVKMIGYDIDIGRGEDLVPAEDLVIHRGETLKTALYFRTVGDGVDENYTIFVHLADVSDGRVLSQDDHQPLENSYPTSKWPDGEVVVDRSSVLIPEDIPDGKYQLEVGVYDVGTNQRLPVYRHGTRSEADKVILSTFEIR